MSVNLAQIIRARRSVRGLERQDLAAAIGCDVRTVRRWESGSLPRSRHLPALRAALGIPLDEMDRIMLELIRDGDLRIEGPEFLEARGLSHGWLAETLLAMDRRLIDIHPALGVHDPDQWAPVFEALPNCWRLLTHRGEIIGNWQFVPLAPGIQEEMRAGRVLDSQIRLDHLVTLDLPGEFDMNVTAMVLEPSYRMGKGLVMLLRSFLEQVCELAHRKVFFSSISANAWTPEAILLCQRLGMHASGKVTNERGVFFETTVADLPNSLGFPEVSRLVECYHTIVARPPNNAEVR
ncbi:MAG: helix-turn-helix domain-containing protein [Puniceicoccaceae bacterium]|nr:MAG: helix-turn-helix domain-containing protein [Puniceicoccaceae bacterium]